MTDNLTVDRTWTGEPPAMVVPSGAGIVGPITIVGVTREPTESVERVDFDDKGLDDVAIGPVEMFRLERMGKNGWWCAVYLADGSRHVFWLTAKKGRRITGTHHKEAPLPEERLR